VATPLTVTDYGLRRFAPYYRDGHWHHRRYPGPGPAGRWPGGRDRHQHGGSHGHGGGPADHDGLSDHDSGRIMIIIESDSELSLAVTQARRCRGRPRVQVRVRRCQ
jgi:hypothetical protein